MTALRTHTPPHTAEVLQATALTLGYTKGRPIVADLDLSLTAGEFVAIVGPNGCGKSTLLRSFARLLPPRSGELVFNGRDIAERSPKELARELGLLAQDNSVPEGILVSELVARGRFPHRRALRGWTAQDAAAVAQAMAATGVTELAERELETLSGGQSQRVWLAMALAQETHTLLLDEPTTYLDITHQLDILALFARVNREHNRTIIAVLHDLNHAARYADRIVAMRAGQVIVNGPPGDVLTAETVEAVFDLPCLVIPDPVTGTPLIIPKERR